MNISKFLAMLFCVLLMTAVLVGAGPPPSRCAEITVVSSFEVLDTPHGLTFDGEHLYYAGRNTNPSIIYKLDTAGNVLDSFTGPALITGLAYEDGHIWAASDLELTIYELTPSGDVLRTFDAPGSDSTGLVFQGGFLWNGDWNWNEPVAYLHRIKITNKKMLVKTYEAPGQTPAGLAFDGRNLWHVDQNSSTLYKLNPATKVRCAYDVREIVGVSGAEPIGLTFNGTALWMSMIDTGMIYQLDIGE